jgi:hypothetical protein
MCRSCVFVYFFILAIIITASWSKFEQGTRRIQSKASSSKTLMLFVLFQFLRHPLIYKTTKSNHLLTCFDHTACTRIFKWTFGDEPHSSWQCTYSSVPSLATGFSSRHLVLTTHLPILCILEVKLADSEANHSSS